jgi:hypothetical protein
MALAVRRGDGGQLVAIDHVTPAVSNPFVVSGRAGLTCMHANMYVLQQATGLLDSSCKRRLSLVCPLVVV